MENGSHMFRAAPSIFALVCAAATLASTAYCLLCAWAAMRFRRASANCPSAIAELPPVSILKPLKGADPEMYEALRSHCLQDYPEYELLFGITSESDPAAEVVKRLIAEFPERKLRLIVCQKRTGANGKVSTLTQLVPQAAHEHFLVNDSDIRVERDYLQTVMTELSSAKVGLVTCLYRGRPSDTLASRLERLGISTDFMPGVLAAQMLEGGIKFGLGSTLAFRKRELSAIGGFESFADYLADDYELGKRICDLGLKVKLSHAVVATSLPAYTLRGFLIHQLRWAHTIRASRPGGYAGLLLTFTLPWAIALIFSFPHAWAVWLFSAAVVARFSMARANALAVRDDSALQRLWLLPLRDVLAVAIWISGLFGRHIVWRGERFKLKNGKLYPV